VGRTTPAAASLQETDPNGQKTAFSFNPDDTIASKSRPTRSAAASPTSRTRTTATSRSSRQTSRGGEQAGRRVQRTTPGATAEYHQRHPPHQTATWDHNRQPVTFGNTGTATYNSDNSLASSTTGRGVPPAGLLRPAGELINDGKTIHVRRLRRMTASRRRTRADALPNRGHLTRTLTACDTARRRHWPDDAAR